MSAVNNQQLPPKQSWLSPKIEIRESRLGGQGMFALELIAKGEKVVVWGGFYTTDADEAQQAREMQRLVIQWDENLYSIEERNGQDIAYFINHSCEPNVWMGNGFTLQARRDIQAGEEVTADYALWEGNPAYISQWRCACGAKSCRGRVTGHDWEKSELQTRYKGYFSPLLNKKIAALHNESKTS